MNVTMAWTWMLQISQAFERERLKKHRPFNAAGPSKILVLVLAKEAVMSIMTVLTS